MTNQDVALRYLRAGLCVLPARLDEKRPVLAAWKQYQSALPTEAEVRKWFAEPQPACLVCGQVSGHLEILDFDQEAALYDRWHELIAEADPILASALVVERTQSGGRHVAYRCESAVCGNLKLAQRAVATPDDQCVLIGGKRYVPRLVGGRYEVTLSLIETRGEGGLFLCAPTDGYVLEQGEFEHLPVVTNEQRELLLEAAWSLNEVLPVLVSAPETTAMQARPGDDFNQRGDVRAVLKKHGWQLVRPGENEYWRRPGKEHGVSATLKNCVFYVFSSNAAPFEPQQAYSPFSVYALLEHEGDFSEAASALSTQGFGSQESSHNDVDLSAFALAPGTTNGAANKPPMAVPKVIVRRLSDVKREFLDWLWPGRIPLGKLTLLAGDPGLGKSLVSLDMAARVSRGDVWPDNSLCKQPLGSVILFNAEDDLADTIAPRLDRAGADDTRIFAVEGIAFPAEKPGETFKRCFSLENDLPRLEQVLLDNADTRLVVIDPISAYCGNVDSHKNAEVRSLLAPLAELAGRYRVAVVAVTHLSKTGGSKAVYRAMGSLAFAAASRAVWSIVKDQSDHKRRLFLPAKLNLGQDPDGLAYRIVEGHVAWEPDPVQMHADEAFAAEAAAALVQPNGKGHERREAMDWLREQLTGGPQPSKEIIRNAKEFSISESTLRRAYKEMGGKPRKCEFDGGWNWQLPDDEVGQMTSVPLT